jgi:DNA-binding MarR family transcriptional regulator
LTDICQDDNYLATLERSMRRTHRRTARASRSAGAAGGKRRKKSPATSGQRKKKASAGDRAAAFHAAFQRLVGEVFRFNGRLLDVAGSLARDLHVTPTHWQIIAIVREQPMTIPAISRLVGLRRQSVQHNISQLVAGGLVEHASNPDHRRATLIRLSPAGQALMRTLLGRQERLAEQFTAGLGLKTADIDALGSGLRRMRERSEASDRGPGGVRPA